MSVCLCIGHDLQAETIKSLYYYFHMNFSKLLKRSGDAIIFLIKISAPSHCSK